MTWDKIIKKRKKQNKKITEIRNSIHKISFRYQHTDLDAFQYFLPEAPLTDINIPIGNYATAVSSWVIAGIDTFILFSEIPDGTAVFSMAPTSILAYHSSQEQLFLAIPA